jgi:hypothetical protein
MTRADYTHISLLLDRSGSMAAVADDTIGGFNEFVAQQQKQPGDCTLTLVQFDSGDPQEVVHDRIALQAVPPLTRNTFQPRGGTPLLDAMGQLIDRTGAGLAAIPEPDRPGRVIVVILTDGHENASTGFTRDQIFAMIRHQQDVYAWQFIFLGANQDAIEEARALGIARDKALTYRGDADGTRDAIRYSTRMVSDLRRARSRQELDRVSFTPEERAAQSDPPRTGRSPATR